MQNDMTLLYYTAHTLSEDCASRVRAHLLENSDNLPIVSVSQKPLDFGNNICVGKIGQSYYNCYKQIYTGARHIKTKYVACCEDDTLYNVEHFNFKPPQEAFYYNKSMWYLEKDRFWHKWQTGMFGCIAPTALLLENLKARFDKYPEEPLPRSNQVASKWMEPGRYDGARLKHFETKIPLITFNYFNALGGKTKSVVHKPAEETELEYWGRADALMKRFWRGDN